MALGWTLLCAFVDKLFGSGVPTCGDTVNAAVGTIAGEPMCDFPAPTRPH